MEEKILYYSLKYDGDYKKIYEALLNKEEIDPLLQMKLLKGLHCRYTTILSEDYPPLLRSISCPPFVLYYYGDLSLVHKPCIAVVGNREVDDYGETITEMLTQQLVQAGYVIVSGLARGVDGIAHRSAIMDKGNTIAILGSGIDNCYPKRHSELYDELKKTQLIMSEFPYMSPPLKYKFPLRNRIVAGLSQAVLVTQAKEKSGTSITIGYALEQGKDVYCVPSRIGDPKGCNLMIQQGAKLVLSVDDIVEENDLWLTK